MSLLSYGPFYVDLPFIKPETVEYRKYQLDISEVASKKNTLVVLPTALGKTVIAIMCACKVLNIQKGSKVLIMAPTRPLVLQHRSSFLKLTGFNESEVVWLTGTIPKGERELIWSGDAKILVATPQVVRNDLSSKTLKLDNFSLVIFDECHRATANYAYTTISEVYARQKDHPLILGMTASPGADEQKIRDVCNSLFIERVECRTENDEDVKPYLNEVTLKMMEVDLPKEYETIMLTLREMISERVSWLLEKKFIHHLNPSKMELLELGNFLRGQLNSSYNRNRGPLFSAIIAQASSLILLHGLELIGSQGIEPFVKFLDRLDSKADERRSRIAIVKDPRYPRLKELVHGNSVPNHPKMKILKGLITDQLNKDPTSKILIFSQYRDTTTSIVDSIRSSMDKSVARFVGQASKKDDAGLSQKDQSELIEKFRSGSIQILVATSVAEEGLDIPSVDLVIFYEPIPSEIRFIQRKGRTGRARVGEAVVLMTKGTSDIANANTSKRKLDKMRRLLAKLNSELQQKGSPRLLPPQVEKAE